MNDLFIFLFLLSIVLFPVVVLKPQLLSKITKYNFTRRKAGLLFGGITVVLFILIGLTSDNTAKNEQKIETKTTESSIFTPTKTQQDQKLTLTPKPTITQTQIWQQMLFDIGEPDKNYGETTTQKFTITSNKWRLKWAKRANTQMSIEVFDSNDKPYGKSFTADFGQTEGILNFDGAGMYYIRFIGGTNKSAGSWDITVEQLK